jgi:hypothetical protein
MKLGRPARELIVSEADRAQLESIARSQSLPAALARRAQIVLRMADGESSSAVARRFRVSRPTVSLWRRRFGERGIAGLHNEIKPGRPRSTSDKTLAKLITTALQTKPKGKTHWSNQAIRRGSFNSVTDLKRKIKEFVEHYNRHPRPFAWTATAESVLAKLERL